jgi:hypothetical protein
MVIRLATRTDERPLRRLIMAYLAETYERGGDFPATLENAAMFVELMMQGAEEYDPCLVAEVGGKLIAFFASRGTQIPGTTTRYMSLRSWGTYILPEFRSRKLSQLLWLVGGRVARQAGYTRMTVIAPNEGVMQHVENLLTSIAGFQEIGRIIVWDFGPRDRIAVESEAAKETSEAPSPLEATTL